ncbi:hypothetical protein [Sphingorhabdus sp. EL138]|uniref:hypothetical protein n=1 Tax=Sphingorhabdus sp. EL138 TaxID=2073156 RepID=UPI0025F99070|nr:hypothetical protein [Sphingorhabdus sp. EL138]
MRNQRRLDPNNGLAGDRMDYSVITTSSHEVVFASARHWPQSRDRVMPMLISDI